MVYGYHITGLAPIWYLATYNHVASCSAFNTYKLFRIAT